MTEEGGLSNATGVHGAERDTQLLVVTAVKLTDGLHVADLAILLQEEEVIARRLLAGLAPKKIRTGCYTRLREADRQKRPGRTRLR